MCGVPHSPKKQKSIETYDNCVLIINFSMYWGLLILYAYKYITIYCMYVCARVQQLKIDAKWETWKYTGRTKVALVELPLHTVSPQNASMELCRTSVEFSQKLQNLIDLKAGDT